jgi:uncharacterized protein YjbI with pentapeptide repeats
MPQKAHVQPDGQPFPRIFWRAANVCVLFLLCLVFTCSDFGLWIRIIIISMFKLACLLKQVFCQKNENFFSQNGWLPSCLYFMLFLQDLLDQKQLISYSIFLILSTESIFRGASLSRSGLVTHSLTQSLLRIQAPVQEFGSHSRQFNITQLNNNQINITQLKITQLNINQINITQLNITQHNITLLNITQLKITQHNITQLYITQLNITQLNVTQINITQINVTQINITQINIA